MGRPANVAKNLNNNKPVQSTINTDELIAKAVAEALAKQKLELDLQLEKAKEELQNSIKIEAIKPVQISKPSQEKKVRRFIPDDARIRIEQNIGGNFIIADTRGNGYFIELTGYRDSTTMSFKDLKNFHGRNHTFLNSGKLIITDIISDADICVEDAITDLNLAKIYNNDKMIRPDEIEDYLLTDIPVEEFSSKLKNSTDTMETIVEVAVILFKRGQFTDNTKMNEIRQLLRNSALFTN